MAADPVGEPFAGPGFAIDVAGGPERGDEQLHRLDSAGQRIDDIDGVAGEVDEHLLAGGMALTHGRRQPRLPGVVVFAEPGVTVSVRMLGPILLPEQRPGHSFPPKLLIDIGPTGLRAGNGRRLRLARKQQPLQGYFSRCRRAG